MPSKHKKNKCKLSAKPATQFSNVAPSKEKKPTNKVNHNNNNNNNNETAKNAANAKDYKAPTTIDEMTSRDFQIDTKAHIDVQSYLLKDRQFFDTFKHVILQNRHLFRDRVVLNVNCGIGLLSLFAAQAGAKRVYAVDASNVVEYLKQIVVDNDYTDVVHVIKGKLHEIELPDDTVDVIVANWMGYSLLFESACDAVIYARDKWLNKKTGVILPDVAKLYVAAVEDDEQKNTRIDWWRHVYGFRMECIRKFALTEPIHCKVSPQQVLSTDYCVKTLDLCTATVDDLKVRSKYLLEMKYSGRMHGIVAYFSVSFTKAHTPTVLNTSPMSPRTHWLQTIFFFDKPIVVKAKQVFYGGLEISPMTEACNLQNMQVAFEMFSGDPLEMNLETEMRWFLKPQCLQLAEVLNMAIKP